MRRPYTSGSLPTAAMDDPEPDSTPFDAISTQSNRLFRVCLSGVRRIGRTLLIRFFQQYQTYLDKSTPFVAYRWSGTGVLLCLFFLRIVIAQGWYIVAYCLGIYLLNLFLAFLQPKFDPSLSQDEGLEDGESSLPTKQDDEFRPFIRRLPEFKFWHSATRAVAISFVCSWFKIFDLPVFWPVLVMYWVILFALTSKSARHAWPLGFL